MSWKASAWAKEQSGLSPTEKLLLLCLADLAGPGGECWPANKTLADDAGVGHRTAQRALAELESRGLIRREARFRTDGSRTSDVTYLAIDGRFVVSQTTPPGDTDVTTPRQNDMTPHAKMTPHRTTLRYQEEPEEDSKSSIDLFESNARAKSTALVVPIDKPDFDAWYAAYPHKIGKEAARKAFAKIPAGVTQAELVRGLQAYIATKSPDRAWCNPATWLNQHRWADQPDTAGEIERAGLNNHGQSPRQRSQSALDAGFERLIGLQQSKFGGDY